MEDQCNSALITHEGIVKNHDENSVTVAISSTNACSGCHANGTCGISGKEEKTVEVYGKYNVKNGDSVTILMNRSSGYKALLIGYLFPLLSVLVLLIILVSFKTPELLAGLVSIGVLLPYYLLLFIFKKRLNNQFKFSLTV